MSYTFGIELEIVGMSQDAAARVINGAGFAARVEGYNHTTRPHWKVTTDASIHGRGGACEVVSPVLNTSDLSEAQAVVRALAAAGARVNESTGTHVHLGAQDMTGGDLSALWANWCAAQSATDLLVSPSRRVGGSGYRWARRYAQGETGDVRGGLESYGINYRYRPDDFRARYRALNLRAMMAHGTVEFRQHQGSLNASKLGAWVQYLAALADYSRLGRDITVDVEGIEPWDELAPIWNLSNTSAVLAVLSEHGGLSQRAGDYLNARAAAFAETV